MKFPPGARSREQFFVREAWASEFFRKRPNAPIAGPDGVQQALRKKFGVALHWNRLAELKVFAQEGKLEPRKPPPNGSHPQPDLFGGNSDEVLAASQEVLALASDPEDRALAKLLGDAAAARRRIEVTPELPKEGMDAEVAALVTLLIEAIPNLEEFTLRVGVEVTYTWTATVSRKL